jgi:hypothetical protein
MIVWQRIFPKLVARAVKVNDRFHICMYVGTGWLCQRDILAQLSRHTCQNLDQPVPTCTGGDAPKPCFWISKDFFKLQTRVARWHIFKPNIPIWVNFGGSCNGWFWSVSWPFYIFGGHLVHFIVIFWYILWLFGIFFPFWNAEPRPIWQPCFKLLHMWLHEAAIRDHTIIFLHI